jgi:hypothetical protein
MIVSEEPSMPLIRSLIVIVSFALVAALFSCVLAGTVLLFSEGAAGEAGVFGAPTPLGRSLVVGFIGVVATLGALLGTWVAARRRFYRFDELDGYEISQELGRIVYSARRLLSGWIGTIVLAVTLVCLVAAFILTAFELQSPLSEVRVVCWVFGSWPFVYWWIILRGEEDNESAE